MLKGAEARSAIVSVFVVSSFFISVLVAADMLLAVSSLGVCATQVVLEEVLQFGFFLEGKD